MYAKRNGRIESKDDQEPPGKGSGGKVIIAMWTNEWAQAGPLAVVQKEDQKTEQSELR